jgi:Phosphotransferase enzyme family
MVLELVGEVARRHSLSSSPVVPLRGLGSVNHVFCLGSGRERHVVRIPIDGLRQDEFEVERWCLDRAAKHGISSPRVIGQGDVSGTPYIALTYVEGSLVAGDLGVWGTLGRYGELAHELEWASGPDGLFTRFGRDPGDAWHRHLLYNADQLTETDPLIGLGVYPASEQPRLRAVVSDLLDRDFDHGLRHGDLAPRNLLRTHQGSLVLLDWGQASVGPIPHGDLLDAYRSHVVDGQPTAPELDAFADAMGTPLAPIRAVLDDLLLVEALDRVRWALDNRPDRVTDLAGDARTTLCI